MQPSPGKASYWIGCAHHKIVFWCKKSNVPLCDGRCPSNVASSLAFPFKVKKILHQRGKVIRIKENLPNPIKQLEKKNEKFEKQN